MGEWLAVALHCKGREWWLWEEKKGSIVSGE